MIQWRLCVNYQFDSREWKILGLHKLAHELKTVEASMKGLKVSSTFQGRDGGSTHFMLIELDPT